MVAFFGGCYFSEAQRTQRFFTTEYSELREYFRSTPLGPSIAMGGRRPGCRNCAERGVDWCEAAMGGRPGKSLFAEALETGGRPDRSPLRVRLLRFGVLGRIACARNPKQ